MPRVEPGRWLNAAIVVLAFAALGFGLAYRFGGGQEASAESLVTGTQIGAALGLAAGAIALIVFAVNDSRRIEVARQLPHASVVQVQKDQHLIDALRRVQPGIRVTGTSISVAFDTLGVSFWTGSTRPRQILFVPARDVRDVSLGEPLRPFNTRGKAVARMRVVVDTESGPTDVQFVVRRVQGLGTGFEHMTQPQVVDAVRQANGLRGGAPARGQDATHFSFVDSRVPGTTAWAALRSIRRYLIVFAVLLVAGLVGLMTLMFQADNSAGILLLWIASVVLSYAPVWALQGALKRSRARERAAGYTTLQGLDLDLRQVQPLTGRVIRQAGAPQLSQEEFRRALSMA